MMENKLPYCSLSFFYFSYFAFLGAWLPFWTLYLEQEIGFSAEDIGLVMALSTAARIVGPYFWGLLADMTGKRLFSIRLGALLSAISFSFVGLYQQFTFILLLIFVFSFFWNAILSQFEVVTLNFLGSQALKYSRIRLWGSIGFIVFVMLLGQLFECISLSYLPYILMAILWLIFISGLCVPEEPNSTFLQKGGGVSQNAVNTENQSVSAQFMAILVKPDIFLGFLIFFLLQLSFAPYYTFLSIYLTELSYSAFSISVFWSLGVVAEVLLFIVMHRFLQAFSLVRLLQASLVLTTLRWSLTALLADNLSVLIIMQLLHAVSFAALHAIAMEWMRSSFPKQLHGQAQAFYSVSAYGVGGVIGALLSGYTWHYLQGGVFYLAATATFIAFVLSLRLRQC